MPRRKKKFECVEMKNQIQQRLQKEWEGLTAEQIQQRIHHNLSTSDSPIAQWWRKASAYAAARQEAIEKVTREFEEHPSESKETLLK